MADPEKINELLKTDLAESKKCKFRATPTDDQTAAGVLSRWPWTFRKNAYFYKTENGARVGDLFMSLIHTCELNEVNPFDYLTELQKHANELSVDPNRWLPWNYRDALPKTAAPWKIHIFFRPAEKTPFCSQAGVYLFLVRFDSELWGVTSRRYEAKIL
jgi:hypothetical protein